MARPAAPRQPRTSRRPAPEPRPASIITFQALTRSSAAGAPRHRFVAALEDAGPRPPGIRGARTATPRAAAALPTSRHLCPPYVARNGSARAGSTPRPSGGTHKRRPLRGSACAGRGYDLHCAAQAQRQGAASGSLSGRYSASVVIECWQVGPIMSPGHCNLVSSYGRPVTLWSVPYLAWFAAEVSRRTI